MSKFKVGDKVRVVGIFDSSDIYFFKGDIGVIVCELNGDDEIAFEVNFNGQGNKVVFGSGIWACVEQELELVDKPVIQPATTPSKPARVRAFKEDYITRAVRAEMRVHQLECEMNKAVDDLANERTAYALLDADVTRLYGVIDSLTERLTAATEANRTQIALTESYKGLYERMTVWQAIKRACGKAGK